MSLARQNFHAETELALNKQISMELYASYVYQSMAYFFDRDDVALPGFYKFFKHQSDEEREHAEKLMKYINKRGGRVALQDVKRPTNDDWGRGINALESALELEKRVNQSLLDLHALATTHNDPQLCDFIEGEYLKEQVDSIKQISEMITRLKRAGTEGLGEYLFDKDLQS